MDKINQTHPTYGVHECSTEISQADSFHLHFNCSVHCLVISHYSRFITSTGYPVGGKVWGSKDHKSQFNSNQCYSSALHSGEASSLINQFQESMLVLRFLDSYNRVLLLTKSGTEVIFQWVHQCYPHSSLPCYISRNTSKNCSPHDRVDQQKGHKSLQNQWPKSEKKRSILDISGW